jgi:tRNA threonylcarbamoyladenosine biosynthesis protein TsaE
MVIEVKSDVDMKALGERIARLLRGGDVLQLIGDVGAGKTTLAKGIAKGLGVTEDVQSPSFTISRMYDGLGGIRLAHYDFYRLHDAGIMADELRETLEDTHTITVIEWADVVEGVLPEKTITVTIASPSETTRQVTVIGEIEARL